MIELEDDELLDDETTVSQIDTGHEYQVQGSPELDEDEDPPVSPFASHWGLVLSYVV